MTQQPVQPAPHRWPIVAIMLAALVLRLLAAWVHPVVDRIRYPDAGDYRDLGLALANGGEYRVPGGLAVRMPGYPLLIAGIYRAAGPHPEAVLVVQAFMGAATCGLIYWLGRKVSQRVGIMASLLAAVDPLSIAASASLLSEAPFTLALIGLVCITRLLLDRPRPWLAWIALGVLAAAAIYLRASSLYLPLVLALGVLAVHAEWRPMAGALVAMAIIVMALLPWKLWLGAHAETAGLGGLTSLEGISLYEAVYADATGGPMQGVILSHRPTEIALLREADRDAYYHAQAWQEIGAHPARIATLAAIKFARFWNPGLNSEEESSPTIQAVLWLWHVPLFLLAAAGAVAGGKKLRLLRFPIAAPLVYFTLIHMIYLGSVRYRVPLQPLLCMLAAWGLVVLFDRRKAELQPWRSARV